MGLRLFIDGSLKDDVEVCNASRYLADAMFVPSDWFPTVRIGRGEAGGDRCGASECCKKLTYIPSWHMCRVYIEIPRHVWVQRKKHHGCG